MYRGQDEKRVSKENVLPAGSNPLKQQQISRIVGEEHVGSACD